MKQALGALESLILGLLAVIMAAIATIETFLRRLMDQAGMGPQLQKIVLIVVLVLLILAALRLFGRIFGVLIGLFLILLIIHVLLPGLFPAGRFPA